MAEGAGRRQGGREKVNTENPLLATGAGPNLITINSGDTITDFLICKPLANKGGDVVITNGEIVT